MAKNQNSTKLPSPVKQEPEREQKAIQQIGFEDILQALALGVGPASPRLPEQAMQYGSMFGGFPKGFANKTGAKGSISFQALREVSRRSGLLSAILSRRQHQGVKHSKKVQGIKHSEVGWKVTHQHDGKKDFKMPEGFDNLIREAEQLVEQPWRMFWNSGTVYSDVEPNFPGFISKIVDDLLVINRPVVELGLDPLGIPRAFGAIDGANVIPTFAALKYLTSINRDMPKDFQSNYKSFVQSLQMSSEKYGVDLDERTEYIYLMNGRPAAGYRHDEILLAPQFPKTNVRYAGYPPSLTEIAINIILDEIMAMKGNSIFFEYGQMAEVIIAMKGNQNDKHVANLVEILKSNMSGVPGMHRVPLVATPNGKDDIEVIPIKQNHKDMLFDVYIQKLTNLACAVFAMHPSEINEAPRAGDNSGSINQASQTKQINMAQEQGLETMLDHIKMTIMDPILRRINPDLVFVWDYGQSEQEQLDLVTKYGPISTVNERRKMMSMDPLSDEEGGNVIDNQYIQSRNQQQQEQEQAEQQAQMGAPGDNEPGSGDGGSPGKKASKKRGGKDAGKDADEDDSNEEEVDYANEKPNERIERLVRKHQATAQR